MHFSNNWKIKKQMLIIRNAIKIFFQFFHLKITIWNKIENQVIYWFTIICQNFYWKVHCIVLNKLCKKNKALKYKTYGNKIKWQINSSHRKIAFW